MSSTPSDHPQPPPYVEVNSTSLPPGQQPTTLMSDLGQPILAPVMLFTPMHVPYNSYNIPAPSMKPFFPGGPFPPFLPPHFNTYPPNSMMTSASSALYPAQMQPPSFTSSSPIFPLSPTSGVPGQESLPMPYAGQSQSAAHIQQPLVFPPYRYPLPPHPLGIELQAQTQFPPAVQQQEQQQQPPPLQASLSLPAYQMPLGPPPLTTLQPKPCDVWTCFRPTFCQLAPCGCTICREHLGSVIRGAHIIEQDTTATAEHDSKGKDVNSATTVQKKKVFTCVSCRAKSVTAGPAAYKKSQQQTQTQPQQQQSHAENNQAIAGDDALTTFGEFSIHYPHHEPGIALPPGTVFAELPQNVSPDSPFRTTDQMPFTAPNPVADRSLTVDMNTGENIGPHGNNQQIEFRSSPMPPGAEPSGGSRLDLDSLAQIPSLASPPFLAAPDSTYDSSGMQMVGQEFDNSMTHPLSVYAPWPSPPPPFGAAPFRPPPPPQMYPHATPMQQSPVSQRDRRGSQSTYSSRRPARSRAFSVPFPSSAGLPARPTSFKDSTMSVAPGATASKGELTMTRTYSARRSATHHRSTDLTRWNGPSTSSIDQAPLWPVIKIENVPFATTVADLETWLPPDALPMSEHVMHPIHLILHRVTGRTLPHCYVEIRSIQVANDILNAMDRKQLGDRTVRVRWERRGELLRDLFSQEAYFSSPATSLAAAPLPPAPLCYQLPGTVITEKDLDLLLGYCRTSDSTEHNRERPPERAFLNLASIIAKFPWHEPDLCSQAATDAMADAVHAATTLAARKSATQPHIYRRVWLKLKAVSLDCPGFSDDQKRLIGSINPDNIVMRSSPASSKPDALASSPSPAKPGTSTDATTLSDRDERTKTEMPKKNTDQALQPSIPSERRTAIAVPELTLYKDGQAPVRASTSANAEPQQTSGIIVLPISPPSTPPSKRGSKEGVSAASNRDT